MPALRTHSTVRSLEVSTAAPPSLTIIAPTPRAFTFPISHNLSDSPYSSPSNSPFEPDLRSLALSTTPTSSVSSHNDECRTPPPLAAYTHTLFPIIAPGSPPPAPIRRKSTSAAAGGPEERRPKKGDDDYVKRPENAFILFRRKCCEDRALARSAPSSAPSSVASGPSSADSPSLEVNASGKKQRQADLSKTISQQWKALSPEERAHWEALAKEKKREHETLHPNYVYRPQRSSNKNRVAASRSSSTNPQRRKNSASSTQQVEFVVPAPRAPHTRSASAPTPPPYQAIQIPNVYMPATGSFSMDADMTSLMPMITQRGVGNGNGGFDYLPSSSANTFDFEASLQSSNFLRSMFSAGPGGILSPASSTSGSAPSSPYTPATASFHPSAFSTPYASEDAASSGINEPNVASGAEADYSSYASWAASSPWATAPSGAGLTEGDFDIARIPEIGWELSCAAFPPTQSAFPDSEFSASFDGAYEGGEMRELAEQALGNSNELDLHFGDLGVSEMGFDEIMAGQDF